MTATRRTSKQTHIHFLMTATCRADPHSFPHDSDLQTHIHFLMTATCRHTFISSWQRPAGLQSRHTFISSWLHSELYQTCHENVLLSPLYKSAEHMDGWYLRTHITNHRQFPPPPPIFLGAFPSLADFLSLRSLCCVAIHLGEVCRLTGILFLQFLAPLWRACLKHKSPFLSPQNGQTTRKIKDKLI